VRLCLGLARRLLPWNSRARAEGTAPAPHALPRWLAQAKGGQAVYHLAGRRLPAVTGYGCFHTVSDTIELYTTVPL
jgi:hypothetical protein